MAVTIRSPSSPRTGTAIQAIARPAECMRSGRSGHSPQVLMMHKYTSRTTIYWAKPGLLSDRASALITARRPAVISMGIYTAPIKVAALRRSGYLRG